MDMGRDELSGDRPVRLPSVLAGFRCQRTMVCCRPPWRVFVTEQEARILRSLRIPQEEHALASDRDDHGLQPLEGGRYLLSQGADRCVFLREQIPGCALQQAGGLDALPMQCRNFPRSVVGTPAGIEIAFQLDCPTVTSMVTEAPRPFEWASTAFSSWQYPVHKRIDQVEWTRGELQDFEHLEELRRHWWAILDSAGSTDESGSRLVRVLAAMVETPDAPGESNGPGLDLLTQSLEGPAVLQAWAVLARLPARGSIYREAFDQLISSLPRSRNHEQLEAAAQVRPDSYRCATSLLLQRAGVHDVRPVLTGISDSARQIAGSLSLFCCLHELGAVTEREAVEDSLTAASHLWHLRQFCTLELVG